jgi:hypothetical protein
MMIGVLLRFVGCYFTSIVAVFLTEILGVLIFPLLVELPYDFGQGAGLAWMLELTGALLALPITAVIFIPLALPRIGSHRLGPVGAAFLSIFSMLLSLLILGTVLPGALPVMDWETAFLLLHTAAGYGLVIGPMFRWLSLRSAKATSGSETAQKDSAVTGSGKSFIRGLLTLAALLFAWSSVPYLQFALQA